jgi:amino-acid N-acetyltransferase
VLTASSLPAAGVTKASLITFFVAEDDTRMITGCIGLQEHGDIGLLRSLAVTPDARDSAVGRALVATVEEAAASRRMERLYLPTTTANDFFARYGYQAVG